MQCTYARIPVYIHRTHARPLHMDCTHVCIARRKWHTYMNVMQMCIYCKNTNIHCTDTAYMRTRTAHKHDLPRYVQNSHACTNAYPTCTHHMHTCTHETTKTLHTWHAWHISRTLHTRMHTYTHGMHACIAYITGHARVHT